MISTDGDADPFIIASFNHKFQADAHPNITVRKETMKLSSKKPSSNYRMTVDGVKIEYVSDRPGTNNGVDWCLMIKNKKTGEIVFKPAKFVMFNPDLGRGGEDVDEGEKAATVVDKSNFREMRDILTLKHGSKQKIRALEAKMSSAISKDSLSNMISSAVTQVKESSNSSLLLNSSNIKVEKDESFTVSPTKPGASAILPNHNPEATSPAEIYDLNDLVSPSDIYLISTEASKFADLSQSDRKKEGYSDFILDLCQNLPPQIDARRTRCVYILYLDYLLSLCKLSSDKRHFDGKDFETSCKVSSDVRKILFDRYTDPSGKNSFVLRSISKLKMDKLLVHCIVLLLHLNQFTFSLSKLLLFTSSTDQKLSKICQLLGCKVKRYQTGEKIVTLSEPPKNDTGFGSDRKRPRRTF